MARQQIGQSVQPRLAARIVRARFRADPPQIRHFGVDIGGIGFGPALQGRPGQVVGHFGQGQERQLAEQGQVRLGRNLSECPPTQIEGIDRPVLEAA